MNLSKYLFEAVQTDGEFSLHRGRSRGGDCPGVLVLSPLTEYPRPETLKWLAHAHSLREQLDLAWATRPIAVTRHWDRQVLVLEDPGGMPLDALSGESLDIGLWLRVSISLAAAIDSLHQHGLIHKDIKPANVLVNSSTGQCWLMGFGIASQLPRERQSPEPPEVIAGTLAYMAPEQTGRMNRSIDCRSDLYALGVTLYEMLTGSLPFMATDPMEWVHCQVAKQPVPPSERVIGTPSPISAIIMKLLAKTPEERYQTAAGVERDLRHCLELLEGSRPRDPFLQRAGTRALQIEEFAIGQHDTPDRLLIPEKLYGRASEIEILLAAFDRIITGGRPELVLVSGYSGIGKSSVVNELHRSLVPPRGLFAAGKFDQYKRDVPYATLAQAFQNLLRPLLAKSETELGKWRDTLCQALDPNGQLIVDLVPELRLIIGEQPPVTELPPQDAQRRFQLVFRRFVSVFARPEHPLALFLDDLQWLDAATLDLLEDLLTSDFADESSSDPAKQKLRPTLRTDMQHLMLIGAYRDNEVDSAHPLIRKLNAIRQAGGKVQEIVLTPLTVKDLEQLLADSLHCDLQRATPLARLLRKKTAGNPFFAIQFLSALAEEGLLTFDHDGGRWSWDLKRIHTKGYTDNVVELLVGKLVRLPAATQKALSQLACVGNSAGVDLLGIVYRESNQEVHGQLWEAVRTGFVFRSETSYRFVHDRVQEAAYSLIPEELRAEEHLRIGRLLAAHTPPEIREERIFEIVNQLNRGAGLIASEDEREQLAELNLMAGRRAKASAAFASALKYFTDGAALLQDSLDCTQRRHELMFSLKLQRAECEFLTGQLETAEDGLTMLSSGAANPVELANVTCLRVDLYTTLDRSDRAVAVCLDYLRHVGIDWSPHPNDQDVRREYERIWSLLGSRTIEDIVDLPLMEDPASFGTIAVLSKALPPALFTDANLASQTICRAVSLSLESGNCDASCFAYVMLSKVAGRHFGDYKTGFRFGQVGYELVERGLKRFEASTYLVFVIVVARWMKHVRASRDLLRRAFEVANRVGDLTYGAYICKNLNSDLLFTGDPLPDAENEAEHGLAFAEKARFGQIADCITTQIALIRMLRGRTLKFGCFDDGHFDELRIEHHLSSNPALAIAACWYWIRKMQARYLAGDYRTAVEASSRAQQLIWTSPLFLEEAEYHFYAALSRAASWDSAEAEDRRQHLAALAQHHEQLQVWTENCPENFESRTALVGAEIARIAGRALDAEHLYERAIRSAQENGFIHIEALAYEMAAHFYATRGFQHFADLYLREARYGYLRWGADGKVKQLDHLYPHLKKERPAPRSGGTIMAPVELLDLSTVVKVSQAVSSEIVLEKLIDTLIRTAVEHAGAERGLLILPRGDTLQIEAEATTSGDTIVVRLGAAAETEASLPESIVHYVVRTHESVILDDALAQNPFSTDKYIVRQRARSILCLPLIKQTRLIGALYLENKLAPHVFTPTRIAVLKLLASQAAISLENTRLYRDLEEREAKIRRLVEANIIGIFIANLEGQIIEANEAFLHMVQYTREDLVSGCVRWSELTPGEWKDRTDRAIAALRTTGTLQPYEKEFFRKDGTRVPVLIGAASFEGSENEGVAFVLDLSDQKRAEEEQKRAQDALLQAQVELARVSRIMTIEQLTSSITHEVNQPLAAVVNSGNACLNWLSATPPNLRKARDAAERVVRDGNRASDVLKRVRALLKKTPLVRSPLNVNEVVREVLALVDAELRRQNVDVLPELDSELPSVIADCVQLQQVVLNLVMNAIESMASIADRPRVLRIQSRRHSLSGQSAVLVAVSDSGAGFSTDEMDRVFEAFYTTKPQGMGMGLWICRSIIEDHGGQLTARLNDDVGATFQFILPASAEERT
jgi:PAS domain S-box-containing protein